MEEFQDINVEINLKSINYHISLNLIENDKFILEVQNMETAEIWRGCYESNCNFI